MDVSQRTIRQLMHRDPAAGLGRIILFPIGKLSEGVERSARGLVDYKLSAADIEFLRTLFYDDLSEIEKAANLSPFEDDQHCILG